MSRDLAVLIGCAAILAAVLLFDYLEEEDQLACITDTECMAFCPANDMECDGGPQ